MNNNNLLAEVNALMVDRLIGVNIPKHNEEHLFNVIAKCRQHELKHLKRKLIESKGNIIIIPLLRGAHFKDMGNGQLRK